MKGNRGEEGRDRETEGRKGGMDGRRDGGKEGRSEL